MLISRIYFTDAYRRREFNYAIDDEVVIYDLIIHYSLLILRYESDDKKLHSDYSPQLPFLSILAPPRQRYTWQFYLAWVFII